jgi:hypothetical protein
MYSGVKLFILRGNISLLHAFKTEKENRSVVTILPMALDGRRVVSVTPRPLYPHVKLLLVPIQ